MPQSRRTVTAENRWYPSEAQLSDPRKLKNAFRQVLKQHYDLIDSLEAQQNTPATPPKPQPATLDNPPPGSGPVDTIICGLYVAPVDPGTLADGTKLTFVKAAGNFQFK